MSILFFKPIARKAIWGHTLVKEYFGYDDFEEGIGQSWSFSTQKQASNVCESEPFQGKTLRELWEDHQELFGHPGEPFPVIISLVGPEDDLSIQVHPDKAHAAKLGFPDGKNEAWYFIEAEEGATIFYGHNARDEQDMRQYIAEDRWDDLIRHLDVRKDDFVYLPAGLLHAMRKGVVAYEIQQATDITYRFYDYKRTDGEGKQRELHLEQAIGCLSYDPEMMKNEIKPETISMNNVEKTVYISNDSFTVTKLEIGGECHLSFDNYELATVIRGSGMADGKKVKTGDNFLIPRGTTVSFSGHMTIMMTTK